MSHNITVDCEANLQDIEDNLVKEILEQEEKWKFLGAGVVQGDKGEMDQCSQRIAVPASVGGSYGHALTAQEKASMGLKGDYKVIGINEKQGPSVKSKHKLTGEEIEQPGPKSMSITADGYAKTDLIMQKLQRGIKCGEAIRATEATMKALAAKGRKRAEYSVIKAAAIKGIIHQQVVKIRARPGG